MRPTQRAVLLLTLGLPVALLPSFFGAALWIVWPVFLGAALFAGGLDIVLAPRRRSVGLEAETPDTLWIGEEGALTLQLTTSRPTTIEVLAELDGPLRRAAPRRITIEGQGRTTLPLVPERRGEGTVVAIWVRWSGPLRLVERQRRVPVGATVGIVPNVRAVQSAALRFFSQREFLAGMKVERYVGDGSEFESMREYVPGLDHRAMNWKVTARHRRLIVQEFRAERNHQVVLALDTGHLMAEPLAGIPKLDHAINAALLLSYVCLRTGDRVGWHTFDERVHDFAPPEAGVRTFRRLQKETAGLRYSRGETNFTLALNDLVTRLRRRSLVVVLSDFVDTVSAELMLDNLARLSRRHLVLFVALRDPGMVETAHRDIGTLDHLYRSVVAADFVQERRVVLRKLRRMGVHCVDAEPAAVSTGLLNSYLDLKRRELF
ncbi:MAG: DUF58 domain-containing protein [Planctomycetota bacterium]